MLLRFVCKFIVLFVWILNSKVLNEFKIKNKYYIGMLFLELYKENNF